MGTQLANVKKVTALDRQGPLRSTHPIVNEALGHSKREGAMNLDKPKHLLTPDELDQVVNNLAGAKRYGDPRKVWVEDGHVFVEGHDGGIVSLTPAVAIKMGRMLSEAGAASLINNVMDDSAQKISITEFDPPG